MRESRYALFTMAGVFITFEGIEGSGKTTVIRRVAEALRHKGRQVIMTREPGGTAIGDEIRRMLLDPVHGAMAPLTEALLYAASRAQHVHEVIRPGLAAGAIVLSDRYADATAAYQGGARRIPAAVIRRLRAIATHGVEPQLTLLLDLPVPVGFARIQERPGGADRLERETVTFHDRVRKGYLRLAAKEPVRIKVIDASKDPDHVFHDVMAQVSDFSRTPV